MSRLDWAYLGEVAYDEGLALQTKVRDAVASGRRPATLLLLEHPPTITLGRRGSDADLRLTREELRQRGVVVRETGRGGLATVHAPGQLVGYPVVSLASLGVGVDWLVQRLADALTTVAAAQGVTATWDPRRPGLWVEDAKLAAFGLHVRRGVTMHGFALNVDLDLAPYEWIVACGLPAAKVTSLMRERGHVPTAAALAPAVADAVAHVLRLRPSQIEVSQLSIE